MAQIGEGERDAVFVAVVAQLDEAQYCRGIEAGDSAEVEHDIVDRLVFLGIDRKFDALEQTVGSAEEDEAGEPEDMDTFPLLPEDT